MQPPDAPSPGVPNGAGDHGDGACACNGGHGDGDSDGGAHDGGDAAAETAALEAGGGADREAPAAGSAVAAAPADVWAGAGGDDAAASGGLEAEDDDAYEPPELDEAGLAALAAATAAELAGRRPGWRTRAWKSICRNAKRLEERQRSQRHPSRGLSTISERSGAVFPASYDSTATADTRALENERGGRYVNVKEALQNLSCENFEISDAHARQVVSHARNFKFQRSARKSVLLNLGIASVKTNPATQAFDTLDLYAKSSDAACITIYLACVIGVGTFELTGAMEKCGVVPGTIALLCFAALHRFLCQRLVEVPQLLEQNFENYTSIAKAYVTRGGFFVLAMMSLATWFGGCVIFERSVVEHSLNIFGLAEKEVEKLPWLFWCKLICGVAFVPFSTLTNVRTLEKAARYSVYSMVTVGVVQTCVSMYFFFFRFHEEHRLRGSITMYGNDISQGLHDMVLAFIGIGMLPYIVAEMVHPQHARELVSKANRYIAAFYIWIGAVCYLGWGSTIDGEVSPILWMSGLRHSADAKPWEKKFFPIVAILCFGLFIIKAVASFPLFLWPLLREIEAMLGFDEDPPTELQLPWSFERQRRRQFAARVGIVVLMIVPLLLHRRQWLMFRDFLIAVPMTTTHLTFPAVIAALAIWTHWRLLELREIRSATMARIDKQGYSPHTVFWEMPAPGVRPYFGGFFVIHLAATMVVASITVAFSVIMILLWLCNCKWSLPRTLGLGDCPSFLSDFRACPARVA